MAKVGEGDPRWIVQDRADGINVNNWHWVEKDCSAWSKQKLDSSFSDLVLVDNVDGWLIITKGLETFSGEVFLNNRKNKLVASYEIDVKVKWSATATADGKAETTSGVLHFPYIADENFDEDPEIRITTEDDQKCGQLAKQVILSKGKQVLLDTITTFLKELKAGGPAKDSNSQAPQPGTAKQKLSSAAPEAVRRKVDSSSKSSSKLTLTETFYARPADIYDVFTTEARVKAFTQSDAKVDPKIGGSFSWFNGSVHGVFRNMCPHSKLELDWRFSTWEDGCFSKVVIELQEPDPGNTILTLTQTNIPAADKFGNEDVIDVVERGWKANIFQKVRAVFGYGV